MLKVLSFAMHVCLMHRFCFEGWKNSTELRQSGVCLFSKRGLLFGTAPLQKTGNLIYFYKDQMVFHIVLAATVKSEDVLAK